MDNMYQRVHTKQGLSRGIQRLQGNTGTKGENRDYKGVPGLWGKLRLQGDKGTGGN